MTYIQSRRQLRGKLGPLTMYMIENEEIAVSIMNKDPFFLSSVKLFERLINMNNSHETE